MELAQEKGYPTTGLSDELWNIELHNRYTAGRDLTLGATFCLFAKGQDHASQKIKIFKGLAKDLPQWLHDVGIIIGTKGTVHGMEETLSTLRGGGTIDAAIWQGKAAISRMNDEMEIRSAEYYMQVMNMIKIHGVKYAAIERDRLLRLVENDAVTVDMHKKLKPRLNVLNQFVATLQDNQEIQGRQPVTGKGEKEL